MGGSGGVAQEGSEGRVCPVQRRRPRAAPAAHQGYRTEQSQRRAQSPIVTWFCQQPYSHCALLQKREVTALCPKPPCPGLLSAHHWRRWQLCAVPAACAPKALKHVALNLRCSNTCTPEAVPAACAQRHGTSPAAAICTVPAARDPKALKPVTLRRRLLRARRGMG